MGSVKSTHSSVCWWQQKVKAEKRLRNQHRAKGHYYKVKADKCEIRHFDYGVR